jgi:hypothetical protein
MNQLIEVKHTKEQLDKKFQEYEDQMKAIFDRK